MPDDRTKEYYKKRPCVSLVGDAAEILENYLNNEAFAFTNDDIETLRKVFARLKKGENKDDIFPQKTKAKGKELNERLEEL